LARQAGSAAFAYAEASAKQAEEAGVVSSILTLGTTWSGSIKNQ